MFSLRTRFNEERIFNRIDSNDVFDNSTQNRCDLVEKYGVGFYREATYWPWKMITSKVSSMPPTSGWQVPRRAYESVLAADIVACSPSTAYVFLWRRTLGRYHSQLSRLGGESLKRHVRDSGGDAAIEVFRFSSVFWVDRLVLVCPIKLVGKLLLWPP